MLTAVAKPVHNTFYIQSASFPLHDTSNTLQSFLHYKELFIPPITHKQHLLLSPIIFQKSFVPGAVTHHPARLFRTVPSQYSSIPMNYLLCISFIWSTPCHYTICVPAYTLRVQQKLCDHLVRLVCIPLTTSLQLSLPLLLPSPLQTEAMPTPIVLTAL